MLKQFSFINTTAKRAFLVLPKSVQRQFCSDLNALQHGHRPFSESKDLSKDVGAGVIELIDKEGPAHRAICCARYWDRIYILHAFTKTANTQTTITKKKRRADRLAMATVKQRYQRMVLDIEEQGKRQAEETLQLTEISDCLEIS